MTHIETIRALTEEADKVRAVASTLRSRARVNRDAAANQERDADKLDLRALAYEDSIDALQRLSVGEASA
jgi:hypothetical protein